MKVQNKRAFKSYIFITKHGKKADSHCCKFYLKKEFYSLLSPLFSKNIANPRSGSTKWYMNIVSITTLVLHDQLQGYILSYFQIHLCSDYGKMHFHVKKLIEKFLHTLPRLNSPTDSYHNPQAEGNYSFSYKQCFLEIYSPNRKRGGYVLRNRIHAGERSTLLISRLSFSAFKSYFRVKYMSC